MLEIAIESKLKPDMLQGSLSHPMVLKGHFRISAYNAAAEKFDHTMLKRVACVVSRGENYQSFSPLSSKVTFADDIRKNGDNIECFFSFSINDHLKFNGPGIYYILCSLGKYTSNILSIKVKSKES